MPACSVWKNPICSLNPSPSSSPVARGSIHLPCDLKYLKLIMCSWLFWNNSLATHPKILCLEVDLIFFPTSALESCMSAANLLDFKHLAEPCLQFGLQYQLCSVRALHAAQHSTKGIRRVMDRRSSCDLDVLCKCGVCRHLVSQKQLGSYVWWTLLHT